MKRVQITTLLYVMFCMTWLVVVASPARAITMGTGGFGPGGEAGAAYDSDSDGNADYSIALFDGETSQGDVYLLDAFLYVDSNGDNFPDDLNGVFDGVTAQLSVDTLPTDLDYGFGYFLQDPTNLLLTYTFTNNTGSRLSDLRFFSYLDAEIIETGNTFFNEYGGTVGTPGSGSGDGDPDNWEIDDPYSGNIMAFNLYNGVLDNTNAVDTPSLVTPFCCDVAMALGFFLGDLNPLDVATITMLISTDRSYLGSYALRHFDDTSTNKDITFSGQSSVSGPSPVPEPGTWLLMGTGIMSLAALRFRLRRKER